MASANSHLVCRWVFAGESRSPAGGRAEFRDSSEWHGIPFEVFMAMFPIVLLTHESEWDKTKKPKLQKTIFLVDAL